MRTIRFPLLLLCAISFPILALWAEAQPYGLEAREPIGPFLNQRLPVNQPDPGKYVLVPAFPHLTFPNPVGLVPEPRSNRLFVHSREGKLYAFENDPNVRRAELILDISARTQGWDDCGLMGLAFHPDFRKAGSTNRGYFYVAYQFSENPRRGPGRPPEKTAGYNRLSRFTIPDGATAADPASELVLIDQYDRSVWHNGGAMFFHPGDGFLYLTAGDEGGVNAEYGNAQRLEGGLFSGVLRIDVDQDPSRSHPIRRQPRSPPGSPPSRSAHYFIPNDNPFQDARGGILEEFWAIGLRSPHRMTCDPVTKNIWLGDVGQGAREEVNLIVKGGNYQWAYREGGIEGPIAKPSVIMGIDMPPVHDYNHTRGQTEFDGDNCVIGGHVYRGRAFAQDLGGKYIFGDNGSGRIWALTLSAEGSSEVEQIAIFPPGSGYSGLSSFGVDHDGELYLCQMGDQGRILKPAIPAPSSPPPSLLSQTGAFEEARTLKTGPALIPYEVNSPLWSDGADKTRWMALPNDGPPYGGGERIRFSQDGEWSFPAGTVFVKHFELAIDEADPARTKRLETRFLVRDDQNGVYGLTYKWRPDHSEADLLPGALSEELSIARKEPVPIFARQMNIGPAAMTGLTRYEAASRFYLAQTAGGEVGGRSDAFHFVHQTWHGDFDVKTRLDLVQPGGGSWQAGLMARESLAPQSRHIFAAWVQDGSETTSNSGRFLNFARRETGGLLTPAGEHLVVTPLEYPQQWVRMRRQGDQFTAWASGDGISWNRMGRETLALGESVQFGLAIASRDPARPTAVRFAGLAQNRAQTWYYPSRRDCVTCHTPVANHVLGVKTAQLNGRFQYRSGPADNQLRAWNHAGMFQPDLEESLIPTYAKLIPVSETAAPLERRVRAYLAANCSQCHRPGGVRANFDARYETPLAEQNLVNGALFKLLDIPEARVVAPGDLTRSLLLHRISLLGDNQMPPLARNTPDQAAIAVVAAWIQSLPLARTTRGLRAEYFQKIDLTSLAFTRVDARIDFDWKENSPHPLLPKDGFSVRWTGEVEPEFSELYTFQTTSDDGVRLWIDGKLLIDNWTDHAPTVNRRDLPLTAGRKHNLRLEYYEKEGGAQIRLAWSSPSQPLQPIPFARLTSTIDPVLPVPPPLFRLQALANGQMGLVLDSEQRGNYSIEATSNFHEWTELKTFGNSLGTAEFIDTEAARHPHRFYRAVGRE